MGPCLSASPTQSDHRQTDKIEAPQSAGSTAGPKTKKDGKMTVAESPHTVNTLESERDRLFRLLEKEKDMSLDDIVPLDDRLAVSVSIDAAESLIERYETYSPCVSPMEIGWDLFRLHGGPDGYGSGLFGLIVAVLGDSDEVLFDQDANDPNLWVIDIGESERVDKMWASFDRPRAASDRLLIDLMDDARHDKWQPPEEITAALRTLETIATMRRAERDITEETAIYAAAEASTAAWLASDDPAAQRVRAEAERDIISRVYGSILQAEDSTDEQCDAAHATYDADITAWHAKYDHLWPKRLIASSDRIPMTAGQEALAKFGAKIIAAVPIIPRTSDCPRLPDALVSALREPLNAALPAMLANPAAHVDALAILQCVHEDTFEAVCKLAPAIDRATVKLRAEHFATEGQRSTLSFDAFITDARGVPEGNNSDNCRTFLKMIGARLRFNKWNERAEIEGFKWRMWTPIDDSVVGALRARANRTHTRFCPAKDWLWETLLDIAADNQVDPVLDTIAEMQSKWDRVPRLDTWLTRVCGVADTPYHRAVSRMIFGGIVLRARHPGCKFDFMPIFYGPQGTLKSTLLRTLAIRDAWFSDEILLSAEAKELVLALAGILVAEIGEMGMRGNTNANHVKAFVSRQVDRGRTAYARTVSVRQRRHVFIGTTNDDTPLSDPTGNRRFLPVRVASELNLEWLRENLAGLYGEAATLEAAGERFELPREVWTEAAAVQDGAKACPEWQVHFREWFAKTDLAVFVTAADLSTFARAANGNRELQYSKYLPLIRDSLGFIEGDKRVNGKPAKVYHRGDLSNATRIVPEVVNGQTRPSITPQIDKSARSTKVHASPPPPPPR